MAQLVIKLWSFLDRKQRFALVALLLLSLASAGFELFGLGLLVQLIFKILNFELQVWDGLSFNISDKILVFSFFIFFVVGILLRLLFLFFSAHFSFSIAHKITILISNKYFLMYPYIDPNLIEKIGNDFISAFTVKMDAFSKNFIMPLFQIFASSSLLLMFSAFLIWQSGYFAVVIIVCIVVFYLAYNRLVSDYRASTSLEISAAISTQVDRCNRFMGAWREIICLNGQHPLAKGFETRDYLYRHRQASMQFLNASPRYVLELLAGLGVGYVVSLALGLTEDAERERLLGTIVVFSLLMIRMLPICQQLYASVSAILVHKTQVSDIFLLYSRVCGERVSCGVSRRSAKVSATFNEIRVDGLSFNSKHSVDGFKKLDLTIRRGDVIGLAGPSGIGKSSIFDWLCGFRRCHAGALIVDGVRIEDGHIGEWAGIHVALLPQAPVCFPGSVRDNIAMSDLMQGRPISMERVEMLTESLGLEGLIDELGGFDAMLVGSRIGISGGQLQRLALLRVLYSGKPILLLDEFTSGLDRKNVDELLPRFFKIIRERKITCLVTSHNVSMFSYCDNMIDLVGR